VKRLAEAESQKQQRLVSDAILPKVIMQAVNYFVAQKIIEALKDMASAKNNHKIII